MTMKYWIAGGVVAAAALGLYAYQAKAADLGGNCCADLEERLAELESSVVRAGNRKVKLTISGVVHKGVLYHNNDDLPGSGKLSVYDGSTDPSRIRLGGDAKVGKDWAAGFVIEVAYAGNSARGTDVGSALISIDGPDGKNEFQIGETGTTIRHSYVYLSGPVGALSIGQQSTATDGIIEVNTSNSYLGGRPLQILPMNFGGALSGLVIPYDGGRAQSIKYETPKFAGFLASAAWQDNESWDAALRWAGEAGGFRMAFGIGYRDQQSQTLANVLNLLDVVTLDLAGSHKAVSGSASIKHVTTGLFANAFYSQIKYDLTGEFAILPPLVAVSFGLGSETTTGMGGQVGVERNWTGAGASTLFLEWQSTKGENLFGDATIYGAGFVQAIDQLAADVYFTARRIDVEDAPGFCIGICKDTDVFTGGMRIRF